MKPEFGNDQWIGMRAYQQDAFGFGEVSGPFAEQQGYLAVLADGMGGMEDGGQASQLAKQVFLQEYRNKPAQQSAPDALEQALTAANRAVCREVPHGGTTLVAALLLNSRLFWASVGDSRLYLLRGDELICLTRDQSCESDSLCRQARNRIQFPSDPQSSDRDSLTSHLGLDPLPDREISRLGLRLEPGDWILLCSDGIYKSLSEQEIAQLLKSQPRQACAALISEVKRKGIAHQDNATAMIMRLKGQASDSLKLTMSQEPPSRAKIAPPLKSRMTGRFFKRALAISFLFLLGILALLAYFTKDKDKSAIWQKIQGRVKGLFQTQKPAKPETPKKSEETKALEGAKDPALANEQAAPQPKPESEPPATETGLTQKSTTTPEQKTTAQESTSPAEGLKSGKNNKNATESKPKNPTSQRNNSATASMTDPKDDGAQSQEGKKALQEGPKQKKPSVKTDSAPNATAKPATNASDATKDKKDADNKPSEAAPPAPAPPDATSSKPPAEKPPEAKPKEDGGGKTKPSKALRTLSTGTRS